MVAARSDFVAFRSDDLDVPVLAVPTKCREDECIFEAVDALLHS